jgi:hypothetical protein
MTVAGKGEGVTHHAGGRLQSSGRYTSSNITGLTHVDFVALPARARLSVTYQGDDDAEGPARPAPRPALGESRPAPPPAPGARAEAGGLQASWVSRSSEPFLIKKEFIQRLLRGGSGCWIPTSAGSGSSARLATPSMTMVQGGRRRNGGAREGMSVAATRPAARRAGAVRDQCMSVREGERPRERERERE